MDDRLLWVVPPSWGWAAAALGVVLTVAVNASARGLVLQRRSGQVRTRSAAVFLVLAVLTVVLISALGVFLLHNRVEFKNGVFA